MAPEGMASHLGQTHNGSCSMRLDSGSQHVDPLGTGGCHKPSQRRNPSQNDHHCHTHMFHMHLMG